MNIKYLIKTGIVLFVIYSSVFILARTNKTNDPSIINATNHAFTRPLPILSPEQSVMFVNGKTLFHGVGNDNRPLEERGVGPLYNATTCASCHINDNRGNPKTSPSTLVFVYNPATANNSDPTYGNQIQDFSTDTHDGKGEADIIRTSQSTTLNNLRLGPLDKDSITYVRIASGIAGAGLVEAIPDSFFYFNADPLDMNNDGISGRISYTASGKIGRFGWTASKATVKEQTLHAAYGDIGLTNSLFKEQGAVEDITPHNEKNLVFYARSVTVPRRRNTTKNKLSVQQGERSFRSIGCASCHIERITLTKSDITKTNTVIYPFSDFLLHNVGEQLADKSSTKGRDADEFRTAPLWGIGLMKKTTGGIQLMHDGRAHSIDKAIQLHEGEALQSRTFYRQLTSAQRQDIIDYINTL